MSRAGSDVKAIFTAALDLSRGPEREAYLAAACGGDDALRRRVEDLLAALDLAGDVLGPPGPPADATEAGVPSGPLATDTWAFDPARRAAPEATDARSRATDADWTAHRASAPGDPEATAALDACGNGQADGDGLLRGTAVRYFGDYEIQRELGRGGMGVVYAARQVSLNRAVALKMVKAGLLVGDDELRRFRNEAEAVAVLDHPGIVPVYEVGERDGQHYFSMKLIPGGSLVPLLDRYTVDPRAAAKLMAEAADAVAHAHARGILHRDLKPANILVDAEGHPHVTDFGLAKKVEGDVEYTQSGAILGTPAYMSPEQAGGRRGTVTIASDVHGLGAVLYALLTGKAPFGGDSVAETIEAVRDRPPEPPRRQNAAVPRDLETICLKCLEKDPRRRYPTAHALADDLNAWLETRPIAARPVGPLTRGALWCRRRPAVAGLSATTFVVALAGLAIGVWQWSAALRNARIADANARVAKAHALQARASEEAARRSAYEAKISTRIAYDGVDNLMAAAVDLAQVPQMAPVRSLVLNKARDAYERLRKQNENQNDAELLWVSARSQGRLGDILAMLAQYPDAEAYYRGAIDRLGSLAEADLAGAGSGRDAETGDLSRNVLLDLVRARLGFAVLLKDLYRVDEANDQLGQAAASGRAMKGSRDASDRALLADIAYQRGVLLARTAEVRGSPLSPDSPEIRESEIAYAEAIGALKALVEEASAQTRSGAAGQDLVQQRAKLARFRNNLGKVLFAGGRIQEAEVELRGALDAVPDRERSPGSRWQRARAAHNLGVLLVSQRGGATGPDAQIRADQGYASIRAARDLFEGLRQEFPDVPSYREELAEAYATLAMFEQRGHRHAEALDDLRQAEALVDRLVEEFPAVPKHRVQSAKVCRLMAQCRAQLQDTIGAIASALKSIEYLTKLTGLSAELPFYRHELWHAYLISALIRLKLTDAEGAARDAAELPRLWPDNRTSYLQSAALLVKCAEVSPGRRVQFHDRAMDLLREGVDKHQIDKKQLEQLPLKALQDREDFRMLKDQAMPR